LRGRSRIRLQHRPTNQYEPTPSSGIKTKVQLTADGAARPTWIRLSWAVPRTSRTSGRSPTTYKELAPPTIVASHCRRNCSHRDLALCHVEPIQSEIRFPVDGPTGGIGLAASNSRSSNFRARRSVTPRRAFFRVGEAVTMDGALAQRDPGEPRGAVSRTHSLVVDVRVTKVWSDTLQLVIPPVRLL
jgi:hypothetical protein